jgi:hypothetical protein
LLIIKRELQEEEKIRVLKKELTEAESTFRALHSQLSEDVPIFWEQGSELVATCVAVEKSTQFVFYF